MCPVSCVQWAVSGMAKGRTCRCCDPATPLTHDQQQHARRSPTGAHKSVHSRAIGNSCRLATLHRQSAVRQRDGRRCVCLTSSVQRWECVASSHTHFMIKFPTTGSWEEGARARGGFGNSGSVCLVFFLGAGRVGVAGLPRRGHARGKHTLMFLSFSFSLPSQLKINK